ncbi:XRE family transcriptional regulator [Plantibacter sp. MMLR14_011]|uniref:helix-turn-helix domain-containing protein n=1 Tax=Plantibacter sp. MMLR14_011 TaxID=1898746 RepID=UPI0015873120|nr:XRE family transcriptional regulator [Plantibacter sp. MMLR14_011]
MATKTLTRRTAEHVQRMLWTHDLSQHDAANVADIPPGHLQLKLAGELDFTVDELDRIATALGCRRSELLPADRSSAGGDRGV